MMLIINRANALMDGCLSDSRLYALHCLKKAGHFFCLFCLVFCAYPLESRNALPELQDTLTSDENLGLKLLFHELFAENELGYTLFGDKPMSFCFPSTSALSFSTKDSIFKIYKKGTLPIFNALAAWDTVKKLTNSENYIFITKEKNGFPDSIFLINKARFLHVLHQNTGALKKAYGKTTPESFLNDLINKKIPIEGLLQQHLLLGILLGYGRHNAELFQRRENLSSAKQRSSKKIEKKLNSLDQKLQPIHTKNTQLLLVKPVNFVADKQNPETDLLKTHYELTHKKLTALFLNEDWLPLILDKLSS